MQIKISLTTHFKYIYEIFICSRALKGNQNDHGRLQMHGVCFTMPVHWIEVVSCVHPISRLTSMQGSKWLFGS